MTGACMYVRMNEEVSGDGKMKPWWYTLLRNDFVLLQKAKERYGGVA